MKNSTSITMLLCAFFAFFSCTKHLEYKSDVSVEETVIDDKIELRISVSDPGKLQDALESYDYRSISKLFLNGPVNGTDLKYIRLMAGADEYGNETDGSLETLDISEARFVEGGEPYFIYVNEEDNTETLFTLKNDILSPYAFGYCKLKKVILPDQIKEIASQSFYNCKNLKSVNIPAALTQIGRSAFCYCNSLKSEIIIPEGITEIPDFVFYECANLSSIILPESVTSLGYGAFAGCKKIVDLGNLPNLIGFEEHCFENCSKLKSFKIPSLMTRIPDYSFSGCQALAEINLSDVVEFGNKAFYNCRKLTSFTPSDKLRYVGHYAFEYSGLEMDLVLPETVEYIGYNAFLGTDITSVTINSDIRTYEKDLVYSSPFGLCYKLKSVHVAEGCKFLGLSFTNCTALESVSLPCSLDSLGYVYDEQEYYVQYKYKTAVEVDYKEVDGIFRGCTSLKGIDLPSNLRFICGSCFYECTSLECVVLPDSLTYLGDFAFRGCSSLSNVSIPKYLDILPHGCFEDCSALNTIILPDNIKEIDSECFMNSNLQSITLPNSLECIGISSFQSCTGIRSVLIPSSVIDISASAFCDCATLKTVAFESEGAMKYIENTAFYHCPMLEQIVLPEGLVSVGSSCFSICGLKEVSVPSSLQDIGEGSFDKCLDLTDFINHSATPQVIKKDIFGGINLDNVTFHVPAGSMDLYKQDSYWGKFQYYVEL